MHRGVLRQIGECKRWDGVGWPYGTGHKNIPVPTQIVEIFNKQVLFLADVGYPFVFP